MAKTMPVSAVGDALIVKPLPDKYNGLMGVADFINQAVIRLVNLETVLSNYNCFPLSYSGGTWVNSRSEILDELRHFGFNFFDDVDIAFMFLPRMEKK